MWWDKSKLLSHNKILNMVLSNRGGGKTYGMTSWCIDDFKKTGAQAVWVRRYQTELDGENGILLNDRFFDAVREKYPDDKFTIQGNTGYINDKPAIHFIALSKSRQAKSNVYHYVNKIIFDEFIVGGGASASYLKNEVEIFLDLFETVARMRDNVRAVLLANAVTIVNPYFLFFKIKLNPNKRFTVQGQICVEFSTDEAFIEAKRQTRFGQLIDGTRYGDYAIDNKWLLDSDTFIEPKTPKALFMLGLQYNGIMYGFWIDYKAGLIFVNTQYDPYHHALYCIQKDDHEPNLLLIKTINDSSRLKRVVYAFRNGLLRFSDMSVKNQFYEFIGYFVR